MVRCLFVVVAAALIAAPALGNTLAGTVREAGTRRPVPAALVEGGDQSALSDEQGAFVLELGDRPRGGTVTVIVDTSGYEPFATNVQLRADRDNTSVELYLIPLEGGETTVRERRSRDNVARGAHRIEGNEVNELPGTYSDPAKAIENFPGMGRVFLSQGGLFIRGAAPNESAIFVDDYEIPDLYHFTGSTSVINGPFVDNVELVPGAFSARYGRSTGGIVVLKTKKLPTDDVHGQAKLDVIDGGAYVGVPLSPTIAVGASARRSYLDLIRNTQIALLGTQDAVVQIPTYWDYQLKLDWDTAPGHELVVFAFGSGDREQNIADGSGDIEAFLRNSDSDFHRVSLRYQHNIGSGFTHTMTPVLGYERSTLDEQNGLRFKDRETYDLQLRDEITWRSGTARVIAGVDGTARADDVTWGGLLADVGTRELPSADLEGAVRAQRTRSQVWRATLGAYVEGTTEPLPGLELTPGMRIEGMLINGFATLNFEPRLAAAYDIVPGDMGTLVRIAGGAMSKPPDAEEVAAAALYGETMAPQTAFQLQGGFEQRLGEGRALALTVYSVWRDELSTRVPTFPVPLSPDESPVATGGAGRSGGAELLLRVQSPKRYFAWLSYSVARHERIDGDVPGGVDYAYLSPFDTTHQLGVVTQVYLPWGFRVGGRYRLSSGTPRNDVAGARFDADAGRFVEVPGPRAQGRFDVFSVLDLRADWQTTLPWCVLDLYADFVNVLNLRAQEGITYNHNFTDSTPRLGLPIIPAVGAKILF